MDGSQQRLLACLIPFPFRAAIDIWPPEWPLEWRYRASTAQTQYRNACFVETYDNGTLRCALYNTGSMYRKNAYRHFISANHGVQHGRLHAARREMNESDALQRSFQTSTQQRLKAVDELKPHVDQLHHVAWHHEAMVSLFAIVTDRSGNFNDQFYCAIRCVQKYTRMECASILELALWKVSACQRPYFFSIQELREQPALDEAFDAAQFLQERRCISGSSVIIPLVISFLQFAPIARDLAPGGTHIPPLWAFGWRDPH